MRLVLLALVGIAVAAAPSSALALTKAERKAVTIKKVDGASTASAAYVEIAFRGPIEELLGTRGLRAARLKVKFVPRRRQGHDHHGKRADGRAGEAPARHEGLLQGPAGRAQDGGRGARAAGGSGKGRGHHLGPAKARQDSARSCASSRRKSKWSSSSTAPMRRAGGWRWRCPTPTTRPTRRWSASLRPRPTASARSGGSSRPSWRTLNEQRAALSDRVETFELWTKIVEKALRAVAKRECNDGMDNDDPEDTLGDFGFDKDPGCVMPLDNDEADVPLNITCPDPGESRDRVRGADVRPAERCSSGSSCRCRRIASDEPRLQIVDAPVTAASGGPVPDGDGRDPALQLRLRPCLRLHRLHGRACRRGRTDSAWR